MLLATKMVEITKVTISKYPQQVNTPKNGEKHSYVASLTLVSASPPAKESGFMRKRFAVDSSPYILTISSCPSTKSNSEISSFILQKKAQHNKKVSGEISSTRIHARSISCIIV